MGTAPKPTTAPLIPPAPTLSTNDTVGQSAQAAREAQRRNALRRGFLNWVKSRGGLAGDTSTPIVGTKSLIGS